ncbi:MAG TPA: Zn-ribbon domain-containing OB-fold protein [Dehalococcoidales bacterium]|nr:Zn-ribbon domain-containing OB-fold protein [Dehalococcoidales bacterium]
MEYKLNFDSFREGLKEGKLLGLKCQKCAGYTAPPQKVCAQCGSEDMDVVTLSGKGTIQTFTVIHVAPEGFESPFVVAMAELEEGPWLMGNVEGIDPEKVNMDIIGRRVTIGYKDVPADMISAGERIALTFKLVG